MTRLQGRVLWVAILASFVAFLDGAIVNVALPAIQGDLGGGLATQQWVVDAYLLSLGALILIAGSLSDTFGRIRILRVGLLVFGLASLACAVAPTGTWLIAARAVQGAGAALLVPSSLALITSTFSGPAQAKAIGSWTGWTGTAFVAGPLIGGGLVEYASWRLVFAINVLPIAATLVVLAGLGKAGIGASQRAVARAAGGEGAAREGRRRVDLVGAVLAAVGLAGTVFALIEQQRLGWDSPAVVLTFVAGIVLLAAFLLWEARTPQAMMPLELFRARNFGVGNLSTAFIYAGVSLGPLMVVIFLQEVAGFTAEPMPLCSGGTALRMAAVSGATVTARPRPYRTRPGSIWSQKFNGWAAVIISKKPAPATAGPTAMNRRGPWCPASAPNMPASNRDSTATGSVASPACAAVKPATSCRKITTISGPRETPA